MQAITADTTYALAEFAVDLERLIARSRVHTYVSEKGRVSLRSSSRRLFGSRRILAQLRVHRPTDSRNDLRHGLHICSSGVEVHDAGTQHVAAVDDGVGD